MDSDLFIPKKIKVGFQDRKGTYTGKLAYVIYFDNKGVLRKEKSWEQWRDKKIEPQEFDNNPQDGFCLNKDVKRFNWSHFGSNRSYIRMYDPRGIEFEVTPENLIGILTETDCLKRGLEGKFVYAWKGTELVLLPCGSEAYQKAIVNTERQDQDISAKDLKPGHSYTTKKGEEVIYLGRFHWFEWSSYDSDTKPRKGTKQHIFVHPEKPQYGSRFFKKSDVKFLAVLNSTEPVLNYADLIDEWNSDPRSASIQDWESEPETVAEEEVFENDDLKPYPKGRTEFVTKNGDNLFFWLVRSSRDWREPNRVSFSIEDRGTLNTKTMVYNHSSNGWNRPQITKEQVLERIRKASKVNMVLSNGKKVLIKTVGDVSR